MQIGGLSSLLRMPAGWGHGGRGRSWAGRPWCAPGLYSTGMDATDRGGAESTSTGVPALDLGARLRAERLRQGMSLREMARRLGVSASAVSQIETGKAQPSVSKLFDIVNLLGTSLDGLLAGAPARRRADRAAQDPHEGSGEGLHEVPPEGSAVVARGPETEGFLSFQRSGEHEVLELESGVQWRRLT